MKILTERGYSFTTNVELRASRNHRRPSNSLQATSFKYENVSDVPSSMDWRKNDTVTPIKDQGQRGCCWAFTTVTTIEGINVITTNKLISLSEQELVDYDKKDDAGCEGGNNESNFEFIIQNGGITTEESYPYTTKDGTCNTKKEAFNAAKITGYEIVPPNEEALLKAMAHQPVAVGIDASDEFMQYTSGVFTGECGIGRDHAVLVARYETIVDGTKYWLMKNSWGTTWVRMVIEEVTPCGLC